MEKGEASVIAVENWWTSKYLLEEIRNSETNQAAVTFTDEMKDYLQLQYDVRIKQHIFLLRQS